MFSPEADIPQVQLELLLQCQIQNLSPNPGLWHAKSVGDIDSLIHLKWIYSEDNGMLFRLEKCGQIIIKKGKISKTVGMELPATA